MDAPTRALTPTQRRHARDRIVEQILAGNLTFDQARTVNRAGGWAVDLRPAGGPQLAAYRLARGELAVIAHAIRARTGRAWAAGDARGGRDDGR